MKEERLNSTLQQKFDGFSYVPKEYQFQQQKVWEQLEAALQPAKPKRKIIWLPWAAVFLLLIGGYALFALSQKPKLLTPNIAQKNVSTQEKSIPLSINQNKAIAQQKSKSTLLKNKETAITYEPQTSTLPDTASIAAVVAPIKETIAPASQEAVVQQNAPAAPVIVAKKARLKVIHINELYDNAEQPLPLLTKNEEKRLKEEKQEQNSEPTTTKLWWKVKPITPTITLIDQQ